VVSAATAIVAATAQIATITNTVPRGLFPVPRDSILVAIPPRLLHLERLMEG
jgi:hypothetical protein